MDNTTKHAAANRPLTISKTLPIRRRLLLVDESGCTSFTGEFASLVAKVAKTFGLPV